jgi:hypothetical protein
MEDPIRRSEPEAQPPGIHEAPDPNESPMGQPSIIA